jgi:hypothetical protein
MELSQQVINGHEDFVFVAIAVHNDRRRRNVEGRDDI